MRWTLLLLMVGMVFPIVDYWEEPSSIWINTSQQGKPIIDWAMECSLEDGCRCIYGDCPIAYYSEEGFVFYPDLEVGINEYYVLRERIAKTPENCGTPFEKEGYWYCELEG